MLYRRTHTENPMSRSGHAMFTEYADRIGSYGKNLWGFDEVNATNIEDLKGAIIDAWEKEMASEESDYDLPKISGEEAYTCFDPSDIVMSAEAYDDEDVSAWLWDTILDPEEIMAVYGEGWAIVYDEELINAL
ncbi:hypothetical protein [Eubacterium barkeri]|uniref:Uncharacterized protein n=1 Tax=Eubacterium barkeri TaxID=1528 RepID=A0A1H3INP2_EUBBA|nr:hypothetical protein [Eubacterium barkeri]SDY29453.1 hypothetical protein SAMN04488579_12426 [Eubacterium barkeri]